ncbi:MAG: hypothetical protein QM523_11000 [Candidatus Pacebacteria bacterium]|nr:hypothetical protein [Candidatus Paceibacterota bacterium]
MDIKAASAEYTKALEPKVLAGSGIQTYDKKNAAAAAAAISLEASKSTSSLTSSSTNTGLVTNKVA